MTETAQQWGDFWHKKLNTWAHVVDFDHNGKIGAKDYRLMAKRCSEIAGHTETEKKKIEKKFMQVLFTKSGVLVVYIN